MVRAIDQELAAAGVLGLDAYDVLLAVCESPGRRIRLSDLAATTLLTRSGVTRLADRLEAAGLLRREGVPGDRRGAYAVLTADGLAALRRTWAVYEPAIDRHFGSRLADEEAAVVGAVMSRLASAAGGAEVVPLGLPPRPGRA
jgi:DNA-binding MarR family transcriptional regulator